VKARQDFLIIAILVVFSATLLIGGSSLGSGSGLRMGSGSFPRLIGSFSLILAAGVAMRLLRRRWRAGKAADIALPAVHWQSLISISVAVLAFALLIRSGGLVAASFLTVIACTFAQVYRRTTERLALAVGLSAAAVLIFVNGLGLPFQLLPVTL